ncbi:MAG TPA: hypothetical protein P5081_18490 [Phycisphaerae bacterium]|nr:hypothetical protein [Phycisphaerae bacterium]HRW54861.1 hypothetical protein [Phycisphaerae bacterium]
MRTHTIIAIGLATLGTWTPVSGEPEPEKESPTIRLRELPRITLPPYEEPPPANRIIDKLIDSLANMDAPYYGLSPTLSGNAFAPLDGMEDATMFLLADHQIKQPEAFRKLVSLGPAALPRLLKSLDDDRPTKITIRHEFISGAMVFGQETDENPLNPIEQRALGGWRRGDPFHSKNTTHAYTVKVGDVCFVAIGQIVSRWYSAVRYQPTACIVVNSPVRDRKLARVIRRIWSGPDPRKKLFNSLLTDYATEGIYKGGGLDEWDAGSEFQTGAATRLLYYFPKSSAKLIADRLNKLDVTRVGPPSAERASDEELRAWMAREVRNGVRTCDFIRAVAWSREPEIVAALDSIRKRTTDTDIIDAISPPEDE